jgi:hypothetical protein
MCGSLDGKVAIVTGGGTGIGESIVRELGDSWRAFALTGRRLEPLQALSSKLPNGSVIPCAVGVPVDVAAAYVGDRCGNWNAGRDRRSRPCLVPEVARLVRVATLRGRGRSTLTRADYWRRYPTMCNLACSSRCRGSWSASASAQRAARSRLQPSVDAARPVVVPAGDGQDRHQICPETRRRAPRPGHRSISSVYTVASAKN